MTDLARPAIGINTYVEPSSLDQYGLVMAAQRKALAILSDGRDCRLLFWGTREPATRAKILLGGRHYMIDQADIILIALDGQGPDDPF